MLKYTFSKKEMFSRLSSLSPLSYNPEGFQEESGLWIELTASGHRDTYVILGIISQKKIERKSHFLFQFSNTLL